MARITRGSGTSAYLQQSLGTFNAGDTIRVQVKARGDASGGGGRVAFAGASVAGSPGTSNTITGPVWQDLLLTKTLPAGGDLSLQLLAEGTEGQQGYFDNVQVSKLPPALTATGQPNLWPDPGAEGYFGAGGGVSSNNSLDASGNVVFDRVWNEPLASGEGREGLHAMRIASSGVFERTVQGLTGSSYLFSVWKNTGSGWEREHRGNLVPTNGSLTVRLDQAGLYDQFELVPDTGTLPEAWIPENRLGRVDWFITDHLGSTKLLIDQNGQHRFTGDDDPYGINLRSFGDKDSHRYTGQIHDEEQGVYYYGARYYLPEIGRFLSGDPLHEFNSAYLYARNQPTGVIDPDGKWSSSLYHMGPNVHGGIDREAAQRVGGFPKEFVKALVKADRKWDLDKDVQKVDRYHGLVPLGTPADKVPSVIAESKAANAVEFETRFAEAVAAYKLGDFKTAAERLAPEVHFNADEPAFSHGWKEGIQAVTPETKNLESFGRTYTHIKGDLVGGDPLKKAARAKSVDQVAEVLTRFKMAVSPQPLIENPIPLPSPPPPAPVEP